MHRFYRKQAKEGYTDTAVPAERRFWGPRHPAPKRKPAGCQIEAVPPQASQSEAPSNHGGSVALLSYSALLALVAIGALCLEYIVRVDHRDSSSAELAKGAWMKKVLHALWTAGNNSLHPCTDFYQYACSNYDRSLAAGLFHSTKTVNVEVLLGLSRTDAARVLFTYYRSCLSAHWYPEDQGQRAVQAILKIVYVGPDMTPLTVFSLILRLNLVYGVHVNLLVYHYLQGFPPSRLPITEEFFDLARHDNDSPKKLAVLADSGALFPGALSHPRTATHLSSAVHELVRVMKTNVTVTEVMDFGRRLHDWPNADTYFESNTSLLDFVVPGVSARVWKNTVEQSTGARMSDVFIHSDIDALAYRFATLADKKFQRIATAFIVAEAAVTLTLGHVAPEGTIREYDQFCDQAAAEMTPLWILNIILSFSPTTEHNQAIFALFHSLIDTVITEAREIFRGQDAILAEKKLLNLTLVLPYHVYPMDMSVPALGSDYLLNVLYLREHKLTSWLYRVPPGVLQSLKHTLLPRHGALTEGFVSVPLSLYTTHALDHTSSLLRMAVLGFMIADSIWSVLLDDTNWMSEGNQTLERLRCSGPVDASHLVGRPQLALSSCVRALRSPGWHDLEQYWGQWRSSLSQVFYRLLAFYYYCHDYVGDGTSLRQELTEVTSRNADFIDAFRCPAMNLKPTCPKQEQ